jgi:hypothetical protein
MAAYKDLIGQKITKVTSNPGEPKTGQMWYNSTAGKLRGLGVVEAFASSGNLNTGRYNHTGVGSDTAGLVFGGDTGPPPETRRAETEEYNGSGWASSSNMNTTRDLNGGFGIQTAAATAGGRSPSAPSGTNNTEHYNGSSWTAVPGTLNTTRFGAGGFGTQTAGAVCGGTPPTTNATEEYDGSSWTSVNNMNSSVSSLQSATAGTQTAAIRVSGYPNNNTIELYDGTNWTTSPGSLNTARFSGSYQGTQTAGFYVGGQLFPPNAATDATETWDGTSMTTSPATLALIQYYHAGSKGSPSTSGWVCGGQTPAATNNTSTQEYNKSTNSVTAAAWASGGTYPYAAANVVSLGPATAMLNCGGNNSGPTKQTTVTLYNGTSYSSETAMPAAANGMGQGKGGTETAGLIFGGSDPGSSTATTTILYNGSSWTSGGSLSTGRRNLGGLGISTAALAFGGQTPSYTTATEEYGGSSWTSGGALPAARRNATGVGSQTAGLVLAGQSPPGVGVNTSFTYNGTSYSGGPTMINNRSDAAASGPNSSNTSALVYGGSAGGPPYAVLLPTETYDGSSFSTAPSLSTGRNGQGSGASSTEGVQVAGYVPSGSYLDSTEQFTPETTAVNIADFTTS